MEKIINGESKFINRVLWALVFIFSVVVIANIVVEKPIVHPELLHTMPQLVNHGDESFIEGLYVKTFDLNIVEGGGYRPRALGFLIGYVEANLIVHINKFIEWGIRQPFIYIGAIIFLVGIALLISLLFPAISRPASALIGISFLFFANVQTSLYVFHGRSAKVLAFSATLLLLYYFFKHKDKIETKNYAYIALLSVCFFILSTLDEMVFMALLCLTGISIVVSIIRKKINYVTIIFFISCLIYVSYYLWWGRAIFEHFTTIELLTHVHIDKIYHYATAIFEVLYNMITTFFGSFFVDSLAPVTQDFSAPAIIGSGGREATMSDILFGLWKMLGYIMVSLFHNGLLLMVALLTFIASWVSLKFEDKIISGLLLVSGFAIIVVLVVSHPALYALKDLWDSYYFVIPTLFILCAWLYTLSKSNVYKKITPLLMFSCIVIAGGLNSLSMDKYSSLHLQENGGSTKILADERYNNLGEHISPNLFKNVLRKHKSVP